MSRTVLLVIFLTLTHAVFAKDYTKLFRKVDPSVVVIQSSQNHSSMTQDGIVNTASFGLGSGVILSKEGLILTASHVVHDANMLIVELVDGSKYSAKILASIPSVDLALISLNSAPNNLTVAKLGNSEKVKIGSEVFVIGAPYGLAHTLTTGNVSRVRELIDPLMFQNISYIQTDAAINQGNSGGPLFNNKGEVIGIVSHIQTQSGGSEGLGFAVAVHHAEDLLLKSSSLWWGMRYIPMKETALRAINIADYMQGFLIQNVVKGSLAAEFRLRAGIIPVTINEREIMLGGDILVELGGQDLFLTPKGFKRIEQYINSVPEGGMMELTVIRGGKKVILTATKPEGY